MQELVLYYSFSGNTKQLAEAFAVENGLPLCEVRTPKPLGKAVAYTSGCFKAMKGRGMPICDLSVDLSAVATVHIFTPIWAGGIAPPMNSALALLPKGAKLSLHMVSGSGSSNQDKITARLQNMGLEVTDYNDTRQ